jgi:YidC/Oxa1 family membrane protein insertase
MDRKNLFLGLACIAGAMALFFSAKPVAQAPVAATPPVAAPVVAGTTAPAAAPALKANNDIPLAAAQKTILENKHIRATFTSRGGAIEKVELLQQPADLSRKSTVVFNVGNADALGTVYQRLIGNRE